MFGVSFTSPSAAPVWRLDSIARRSERRQQGETTKSVLTTLKMTDFGNVASVVSRSRAHITRSASCRVVNSWTSLSFRAQSSAISPFLKKP